MKLLKVCLIFSFFTHVCADLYTSVEDLLTLRNNEDQMAREFQSLIKNFGDFSKNLENDLKKLFDEREKLLDDGLGYVSNPINAFLLVKRLSYDVTKRVAEISLITKNFEKKVERLRLDQSEFEGAVEGLIRLQITYSLKSEDLAEGIIQDTKYNTELSSDDLFAIGKELFRTERFDSSLSYLELALDKNRKTREISDIVILETLIDVYKKTDNQQAVIATIDKILKLDPTRADLEELRNDLEISGIFDDENEEEGAKIVNEPLYNRMSGTFTLFKELMLIIKACDGKLQRSPEDLKDLRCRMHSTNAFSKLAPFKMEEVKLKPFIVIFHEIISDAEIDIFLETSKLMLTRATIMSKNSTNKVDNIRVSKHSWHKDSTNEVYKRMSQRVGDLSGLNMATAEDWQPQNYGIGGHYHAHYDFLTKDQAPFPSGNGNRVATFLVYLSDVEKGGSTVFPYLSINVKPIKRTAVFWHNLNPSGELEYETRHAGCPVLVGNKWVANKWLHEHGQEWKRPCGLRIEFTDEYHYKDIFTEMDLAS